jgi:hypothetical protein
MIRPARVASFVVAWSLLAVLAVPHVAAAQEPVGPPAGATAAVPPKPASQGVAVLAIGPARDEAFALARAVYGSRLRPTSLDEVRARVLAGAPPPANASRELLDLAEVRAGITGEDAAGRRLLAGLAQQVGAQALLVVKVDARPAAVASPDGGPREPVTVDAGSSVSDAGAAVGATGSPNGNAPPAGNVPPETTVVARLFLADSGDFDAARYSPEAGLQGAAAWRSTVTSLEARFPPPAAARVAGPSAAISASPGKIGPEPDKSSSFYTSAWFWGALAGAALLGGAFYFATRDTGSDPIHLQMTVPK